MTKGISADSQIHISVIFLVKILIGISALIAGYYNIQNKFASIDRSIGDLHEEVVILTSKVSAMELEQIKELEETIVEQKTLLQRMGLKK